MNIVQAVFGAILLVATQTNAQDYEIRMHRPRKEGARYSGSVVAIDVQEMSVTANGKALQSKKEDSQYELESTFTVVSVDSSGRPTKEKHAVQKLEVIEGGQRKVLLPPNTSVTAYRAGKEAAFDVNGKPAEPVVRNALSKLISITSGGSTDDEVFGTKERKRVGQNWDLNHALMQKDLNEKSEMKLTETTGKATLKQMVKEGGQELLVIAVDLSGKVTPPLPPGMTLKSATTGINASGKFPVDLSMPTVEDTMTMSMSLVASGKPQAGGPEIELKTSVKSTKSAKLKRIP